MTTYTEIDIDGARTHFKPVGFKNAFSSNTLSVCDNCGAVVYFKNRHNKVCKEVECMDMVLNGLQVFVNWALWTIIVIGAPVAFWVCYRGWMDTR